MFDPRPLVMMKGPPNLGLALIPILTPSLEHSLFTSMMMSVLVDGDDRSEDDDRSSSDARLFEENRVCVLVSSHL